MSEIVGEHYLQGVPLSSITRRFGLNPVTVIEALDRLGGVFEPALKQLKEEYRNAPVRHADETGWRTDGRNGYSWLFCTDRVSLCLYRQTRSASVVREVLGEKGIGRCAGGGSLQRLQPSQVPDSILLCAPDARCGRFA
ncbi:MAG: transposase [Acidobacteria bacterium]|nr:transposase [Acidobacteriota bacterium]